MSIYDELKALTIDLIEVAFEGVPATLIRRGSVTSAAGEYPLVYGASTNYDCTVLKTNYSSYDRSINPAITTDDLKFIISPNIAVAPRATDRIRLGDRVYEIIAVMTTEPADQPVMYSCQARTTNLIYVEDELVVDPTPDPDPDPTPDPDPDPTPDPLTFFNNQNEAYFNSFDGTDSSYLYFRAVVKKNVDGLTQYLYENQARSEFTFLSSGQLRVRIEDDNNTAVYNEVSTEVFTVADGELDIIIECDNTLGTGSLTVTVNGTPLTMNPFTPTGALLDHTRGSGQGFLANHSGQSIANMGVSIIQFGTVDGGALAVDMQASAGLAAWNAGTNPGTYTLAQSGTFIEE